MARGGSAGLSNNRPFDPASLPQALGAWAQNAFPLQWQNGYSLCYLLGQTLKIWPAHRIFPHVRTKVFSSCERWTYESVIIKFLVGEPHWNWLVNKWPCSKLKAQNHSIAFLEIALGSETWGQHIPEKKRWKWAVNQQPRPRSQSNHSFMPSSLSHHDSFFPYATRTQDQKILSMSTCIRFTQRENPLLEAIRSGPSLTLSKD